MFLIDVGKLLILAILITDLFYFSSREFKKHRETILMMILLGLLCLGSLLNLLVDYVDMYSVVVMEHIIGVAFVGITAMFISVSANIRMKKVMKHEVRVITPNHNH